MITLGLAISTIPTLWCTCQTIRKGLIINSLIKNKYLDGYSITPIKSPVEVKRLTYFKEDLKYNGSVIGGPHIGFSVGDVSIAYNASADSTLPKEYTGTKFYIDHVQQKFPSEAYHSHFLPLMKEEGFKGVDHLTYNKGMYEFTKYSLDDKVVCLTHSNKNGEVKKTILAVGNKYDKKFIYDYFTFKQSVVVTLSSLILPISVHLLS